MRAMTVPDGNMVKYTPLEQTNNHKSEGDPETQSEIMEHSRALEELRAKLAERQERLKIVQEKWTLKTDAIQAQMLDFRKAAESREEVIEKLLAPPEEEVEDPPGPKALYFVNGNLFVLVATFIIIANIVTMMLELVDPKYAIEFFWVDQFFMAFYVVELTLKALLFRKGLLFGKISVVWWNWLDLVIVVSGVLDMWVKPLLVVGGLVHENKHSHGTSIVQMLRMLRLARLARILKIVRVFLTSDLSWSEGDRFQAFIMAVIGANSVIMGFEADMPEFGGWYYVEQILLIIFSFELLIRLRLNGFQFFYKASVVWNWLDFIIVTGGIVDQWMMPSIAFVKTTLLGMPAGKDSGVGQIMMLLRMARLLRILRLVRLVKNIPPLYTLVTGIMEAMQGMGWVLLLTLVVLYTFSLLSVRLLGHGLVFGGIDEAPVEASVFPDVTTSMFVLFKIMNGDMGPIEGLCQVMPVMKLFATSFMILSTWAILSILTAVVSENMLAASEGTNEANESEEKKERSERARVRLAELFDELDEDNSGEITKVEFKRVLEDEDTSDELCDASGMSKRDLEDLFDILCAQGKEEDIPVITYSDFMSGLEAEGQEVNERSMMRIEKRMARLERSIRDLLSRAEPDKDES